MRNVNGSTTAVRGRAWRRHLALLLGLALVLLLLWTFWVRRSDGQDPSSASGVISVEEVSAGQRGYGWTTLQDSQPVRFDLQVLGIVRNARPQQDMILVRLEGDRLAQAGVALGMSGSPVYIDGQLAGAVAYTWTYAKEPIAGVTPIANMLELLTPAEVGGPPEAKRVSNVTGMSLVPAVLGRSQPEADGGPGLPPLLALARDRTSSGSTGFLPLRPAVSIAGLPPGGQQVLAESFERAGFLAVAGPSRAGAGNPAEATPSAGLRPGSPLVVQLARGDLEISALGTVTAIVGDRILAFGHPFLGEPGAELPLARGSIEAVIPRQQVSLKLWSPGEEVGVTEREGLAGLTGRLGGRARMIPVELTCRRRDVGRQDTYHFELARHPTLTPNLLGTITAAVLQVGGAPAPESSAHLVSTFEVEGYPPLRYDDCFAGSGLGEQLAQEVAVVPRLLMSNPFGPVALEGVTISVEVVDELRSAVIEGLTLRDVVIGPGDTVEADVVVVPYRQPRQRVSVRLQVPADARPGPRILVVGDAFSEARLDVMARRHHYEPRSLDQLMSLLREEFKQTRLYARLSRGQYGVAIQGAELPALPPSVMQILTSPLETDRSPIIGSVAAWQETPWVLRGVKAAYLRVTDNQERTDQQ